MVGSATLTTVWSIMIIDSEPVIVARIHQRRFSAVMVGSFMASSLPDVRGLGSAAP